MTYSTVTMDHPGEEREALLDLLQLRILFWCSSPHLAA